MGSDAGAGTDASRRLCVYNGGFLTQTRIRRILNLAGWTVRIGRPREGDAIGVWGQSPTAPRGEAVAARTSTPIVRVEDAFLRSLFPGRAGESPIGLLIDETGGVHFDTAHPSALERLLAEDPLEDSALLDRARSAAEAMKLAHLSKYAATDPHAPLPDPGYVVVIDQTLGDASVAASSADRQTFREMLVTARIAHPGARILIKTHPETDTGQRAGHFDDRDLTEGVSFISGPVSPWSLFAGAAAVYTVSSGLGFEAILAGHKPVVLGRPFYAGWGLTDDRADLPRRTRKLTRAQLFAAAMILSPTWYDPCRDRLCEVEDVIRQLGAQARAWREDRHGWVADGMRRWKHPYIQAFFGGHGGVAFRTSGKPDARRMAWAGTAPREADVVRIEDGFLRSRGLGARLTPPLSLAADDLGIYYDPARESRLERLVAESVDLPPGEIDRAKCLIARIDALNLTKYNLGGADLPRLPAGRRILVVGQVEDDASVLCAAGAIRTNSGILARARADNPDAVLIYRPHPDVTAGLRVGAADTEPADLVDPGWELGLVMEAVDEIWTMTSLLGFEALLRGLPVTVTGAPFYAGWGLTRDLGTPPARRKARPTLEGLIHAALIDYPRYRDPVSRLPCPVEVIVDRLASGDTPGPKGPLARLQRLRARRR